MTRRLRNGCVLLLCYNFVVSVALGYLLSNSYPQIRICSGSNVTNVKRGSIKFVLYLMAGGMMVAKLNTLALIAIYKRLKGGSASPYHKVLFLEPKICQKLSSVTR